MILRLPLIPESIETSETYGRSAILAHICVQGVRTPPYNSNMVAATAAYIFSL
jgi:hypothetical protein